MRSWREYKICKDEAPRIDMLKRGLVGRFSEVRKWFILEIKTVELSSEH